MTQVLNTLPLLAAFSASVTWAIGSSTYSFLSRTYPAQAINFSRALLVLPFFFIASFTFSYIQHNSFFTNLGALTSENVVWLVVSNIASFALGDVFFLASTTLVGVPTALAIASTFPVIAAAGAFIFDGQALNHLNILGLISVVFGTILIIKTGKKTLTEKISQTRYRTGLILAGVTSCFWALNTYSAAKGGQGVTAFDANIVRMGCALVLCPAIGFLKDKKWSFALPAPVMKKYWPIFLIEAFFGSALYIYGMARVPMALGATLTSLAPVLTVPVALWMGWERFSFEKTAGIIIVIVGVSLLLS